MFDSVLAECLFSRIAERINKADVTKKPQQIIFTGSSGINLLVTTPIAPVTIVDSMIAIIVLRPNSSDPLNKSSVSTVVFSEIGRLVIHRPKHFKRFQIFFLKNKQTAASVAKCKNTSKRRGTSSRLNKFCAIVRCPEDDIGRNSATP